MQRKQGLTVSTHQTSTTVTTAAGGAAPRLGRWVGDFQEAWKQMLQPGERHSAAQHATACYYCAVCRPFIEMRMLQSLNTRFLARAITARACAAVWDPETQYPEP
jgi:hypothetical protein